MADKRISQLTDRGTVANNDVVAIVVSGAVTTNKATISSIQTFMQGNLDLGVTSVGITLGSSGTDVSVTGSPITTSGNITINIPDASASARGVVTTGTQTFAGFKIFNGTIGAYQDIQLVTKGTALNTFITNINATSLVSIGSNGFGFNNANNIYFSGSNKQGGIFAFNNTSNQTYTLPDASGTLAFTSDLTGFVTLGTAQTITAQKTFTGSGGSDTMIISHGSGSGFALDVIKAGNGEVIRVLKTSGSGNAMTVQGGNFEAPTIVKTGGTSSQFLMADGSVNTSVLASGAYLPLVGGTLTGPLNGTSGVFTSSLQSQTTVSAVNSTHLIGLTANVGGFNKLETTGGAPLSLVTSGSSINLAVGGVGGNQFTLTTLLLSVAVPYSGTSATLTGALNGTSAVFSGNVVLSGTDSRFNGGDSVGRLIVSNSNTTTYIGLYGATHPTLPFLMSFVVNSAPALTIASTGAATFSSSVAVGAGMTIGTSGTNDISWGTAGGIKLSRTNVGPEYALSQRFASSLAFIDIGASTQWNGGVTILPNGGGNVGIGTATPNYPLTISSTTANAAFYNTFNNAANRNWAIAFGIGSLGDFNIMSSNAQNGDPISAGTSRFNIQTNGNVGIGTATPSNPPSFVRVLNISGGDAALVLSNTNGTAKNYSLGAYDDGSLRIADGTTERMRITSGGLINIATSGTGRVNVMANPSNNVQMEFFNTVGSSVGSITVVGGGLATAYNTTSDYRLKEDLEETNGIDKVLGIKVYNYQWKDSEERMDGVLAHELAKVLPYAVHGEKDEVNEDGTDKMQGVDYSKIVPILIKAIQEQQEQIDSLKNQIK